MKWTAFDQETAAALAQHVENVEVSRTAAGEVESALQASATHAAAVLLPAADREHTLVATFRTRGQAEPVDSEPVEPDAYQAGGFLGLADEPIYKEQQKKR